jgi:hypothetical protein
MTKINDWKPETKSLIERLVAAGCRIVSGDNGEEKFYFAEGQVDSFIDNLIACDEARLYVEVNGKNRGLFLVLGNSPGEIVCDYHCDPVLDAVTEAHYAEWELKGQPLKWA